MASMATVAAVNCLAMEPTSNTVLVLSLVFLARSAIP